MSIVQKWLGSTEHRWAGGRGQGVLLMVLRGALMRMGGERLWWAQAGVHRPACAEGI